jgi:hypothetical protein
METELRELLAKYGTPEVHKTLMKIMRDDYNYLRSIFDKKQAPANQVIVPDTASEAQPQTITLQETIIAPSVPDEHGVKHLVVQPKKKGVDEIFMASAAATQVTQPSQETPVVEAVQEEESDKPYRDPKTIKQFQVEAEAKKRAELEAKGVSIESLLTRENLEKWIRDQGLTYAAVAREHVGCSSELVATTAKAFGIKSANAQKRAVFIARKKK